MKSCYSPIASCTNSVLLLAAGLLVSAAPLAAQTTPAALPGGASSLQETYQDWQVSCGVTQNGKLCAMSQVQTQQNGQRVLAIEVRTAKDNSVGGVLILPFGLKLEDGASLKIDSTSTALAQLKFSTCLPAGCLMPLAFTPANVTTLKGGTTLNVIAIPADAAEPANLTISLKGFAAALDRLVQLNKG